LNGFEFLCHQTQRGILLSKPFPAPALGNRQACAQANGGSVVFPLRASGRGATAHVVWITSGRHKRYGCLTEAQGDLEAPFVMPLAAQERSLPHEGLRGLVERIQSGNTIAESELAQLYYQRIFVMTLSRTHDRETSRDLTQDVLIAVLQALRNGQLRDPGRLGAFVYGTARNLVNDYFRSCKRQLGIEAFTEDLAVADTVDPEISERLDIVRLLLERLDSVDRRILLMMLVEGYKAEEIALRLNLSSDAIRQRKSRAIKKIVDRVKKMSRK
jgi:RNA polymerase sigma factor (sigma-70 family)